MGTCSTGSRAGSATNATPANTASQAASNAVNAVSEAAYNGRASQITRAVGTMFDELQRGDTITEYTTINNGLTNSTRVLKTVTTFEIGYEERQTGKYDAQGRPQYETVKVLRDPSGKTTRTYDRSEYSTRIRRQPHHITVGTKSAEDIAKTIKRGYVG